MMDVMIHMSSNIAHAMGLVSRFMNNPRKEQWLDVKWIIRYLRGTTKNALRFGGLNAMW